MSNKMEELEKKIAKEQSMRDRQPLMTPVSPGKGMMCYFVSYL